MKLAVEFGFVLVNGGRGAICGVGVSFGAAACVLAASRAGAGVRRLGWTMVERFATLND